MNLHIHRGICLSPLRYMEFYTYIRDNIKSFCVNTDIRHKYIFKWSGSLHSKLDIYPSSGALFHEDIIVMNLSVPYLTVPLPPLTMKNICYVERDQNKKLFKIIYTKLFGVLMRIFTLLTLSYPITVFSCPKRDKFIQILIVSLFWFI